MSKLDFNKRTSFIIIIIVWIIFGYVFKFDLTQRWGCLVFEETYLNPYRIILAITSGLLLGISCFLKTEKNQIKLIGTELIIWLTTLILIKGGYAVGFGGVPDQKTLLYDFIGLTLRLHNFSLYFTHLPLFSIKRKRILVVIIASVILITIKVNLFPLPPIDLP